MTDVLIPGKSFVFVLQISVFCESMWSDFGFTTNYTLSAFSLGHTRWNEESGIWPLVFVLSYLHERLDFEGARHRGCLLSMVYCTWKWNLQVETRSIWKSNLIWQNSFCTYSMYIWLDSRFVSKGIWQSKTSFRSAEFVLLTPEPPVSETPLQSATKSMAPYLSNELISWTTSCTQTRSCAHNITTHTLFAHIKDNSEQWSISLC